MASPGPVNALVDLVDEAEFPVDFVDLAKRRAQFLSNEQALADDFDRRLQDGLEHVRIERR